MVLKNIETLEDIFLIIQVGYTVQDVVYRWTEGDGCNVEPDMELSQFDLMKNPPDINTTKMIMNKGNRYYLCKVNCKKNRIRYTLQLLLQDI